MLLSLSTNVAVGEVRRLARVVCRCTRPVPQWFGCCVHVRVSSPSAWQSQPAQGAKEGTRSSATGVRCSCCDRDCSAPQDEGSRWKVGESAVAVSPISLCGRDAAIRAVAN